MRPSNRPAAEASAPHAAQKVNEQTQRLQEVFDNSDTEHRSELDVSQIGKCLLRENHRTLSEEAIEHHRDRAFLENANKVSRAEFVAFDKDVKTNLPSSREPVAPQL